MQQKRKRIAGLDGLRVISLIVILLYHTFPKQFPGGYIGVITFFVISGYLSARSIFPKLEAGNFHLLKYYCNRIKRLYPSLIVVLLVTIAFLTFKDPYRLANTQQEVFSILGGYNNHWQISMQGDYFANITNNSPFTHLWYIAILIQFEIIVPLLGWILLQIKNKLGKNTSLFIMLVITFISFLIMPIAVLPLGITATYYATYTRIFSLLAGFFLGMMHLNKKRFGLFRIKNSRIANSIIIFYIIITILFTLFVPGSQLWVYIIGMQA